MVRFTLVATLVAVLMAAGTPAAQADGWHQSTNAVSPWQSPAISCTETRWVASTLFQDSWAPWFACQYDGGDTNGDGYADRITIGLHSCAEFYNGRKWWDGYARVWKVNAIYQWPIPRWCPATPR